MENQIISKEEAERAVLNNSDNADVIFKIYVIKKLDDLGLKIWHINKKVDNTQELLKRG